MSVTSWAIAKIPAFVLSIWQHVSRKSSLKRLVVDPIPALSQIPNVSDSQDAPFVLAFRFFNENREPIVIRGIQPRMKISPYGKIVDLVAKLTDGNGQKTEFPLVIAGLSAIDVIAAFRVQDNSTRHFHLDVMVFSSTPKRDAAITTEFFRDRNDKQVFVKWQGRETMFGEQRLKPGERQAYVRFRKKMSSPPKMIVPEVVQEDPDET